MALIRQSLAQTVARDAIVLDLGDLVKQGEQLKARARAQADQILAEARAERERLIKGAAEEGRRQGLAQGMEEGKKQGEAAGRQAGLAETRERLAKLESAWGAALEGFSAERDGMLLEARQDVLRLALLAAELVTKRAVVSRPETVVDQLGAILALLVRPTRLVIRVHPDDLVMAKEAMPGLAERYSAAGHVEIVGDAELGRGSAVAKTAGGGSIDASIRTQLERVVAMLMPEAGAEAQAAEGGDQSAGDGP